MKTGRIGPHPAPCPCRSCMEACADYRNGKVDPLELVRSLPAHDGYPIHNFSVVDQPGYPRASERATKLYDEGLESQREVRIHRIAAMLLREDMRL